ncbi:hypothetical protein RB594_000416 [Gaeumannomyces avenae]
MGFLSLFSRKSSSRQTSKASGRGVKAQAYEATTASDTPFQGTYPVAGNGPNVLDTLSKSAKFRQTQVSLGSHNIDPAAPAPTIPLHSAGIISSNADVPPYEGTNPAPAPASKRRNSFRAPPLSFRKPRDQSVRASRSETPEFAQYGAGFTQVFPPAHHTTSHKRNSSLFSELGKSVDVLDAHSEISRADFRTRVQAEGAKEFGEDVADRNLFSHTTYTLDPSQVQAFYGTQGAAARGADRMASLKTYVPTGTGSVFSGNAPAELRRHSMHRSAIPSELRRPATAGSAMPARPMTSWDDSDIHEDVPPLPYYVPRRLEDLMDKGSRLPVAVPHSEKQSLFRFPPATYRPPSSSRPGTASNRGLVPSSALTSAPAQSSSPWAKCTRHALQLSVSSSASGGSGEPASAESAPAPCVKPSPTRSDDRASAEPRRGHGYSRSRSMTFPKPGQLEEIYEHVPERGSSLRNWSLTSDTQSLSSLSTNFFGNRPMSRHTANTSIDASFPTSHAFSSVSLPLSSARGSIYSTDHLGKLQLVPDDAPPMPGRQATECFNMDDYITSDDDSFIAPRRRRSPVDEEDLLFRDSGYGFAELPGLHDSLHDITSTPPAILHPPPQPRRRPATSAGTLGCQHSFRMSRRESPPRGHRPMTSVASIFTAPSRGRSRRRRQSNAAETASLDQQEYPWAQPPPRATYRSDHGSIRSRPSHRGRKGSQRLSAFGSAFSQTGGYEVDGHYAPAPEVPVSLRPTRSVKSVKSAKSVKTTTTTDTGRTLMAGPAPYIPDSGDASGSKYNGTSNYNSPKSTGNYSDNRTTTTGDDDQKPSDRLPVTKIDIAAVIRFRKLDKARRRTMEMAIHRGDKAAPASSSPVQEQRKSMVPMDTAQHA